MRDQLIQYVSLLFAGTENCEDIRQEILQNTLDRYDDLVAQGKSPESAYRQAISGIGDISEILSGEQTFTASPRTNEPEPEADTPTKKLLRTIAIALYILCAAPLIILSEFGMDNLGLCCTLAVVAVATVLILLGKKNGPGEDTQEHTASAQAQETSESPRQELRKSIKSLIWAIGLAAYFIVSFSTGAWYVTWVIFPIIGAVQGLVIACLDLTEGQ
ncbi:MAG: permease prefix domain 1-containing protein [Oscillospiraceae bacterium]|nr:permease prefix domain 1-containing protein [Clostridiales bacterium]MCI7573612.1 permease prefix domain 1-containing protein [Clostridiales bacterium]MDD7674655.1 permease prefix domain 1-containing protein [Oscillospiraceae bacterium]